MAIHYSLTDNGEGRRCLSLVINGEPRNIVSTHPSFSRVLEIVESGASGEDAESEILDLLDNGAAKINEYLGEITTGSVSVSGSSVLYKGEKVEGDLMNAIITAFKRGDTASVVALSNFLEKAMSNPSGEKGIAAMWKWMEGRNFTITEEGNFIAYKGVTGDVTKKDGELSAPDKVYFSTRSGTAFVDGKVHKDTRIPNKVGSVITMPRDKVNADPENGCSYGLHVGTWDYAKGYGNVMLACEVDPSDVVSVPNDSSFQKMRVCRYKVVSVTPLRMEPPESKGRFGGMFDYDDEAYDYVYDDLVW